ncbi:MAG TPA: carboxypeptidase regulatory-like domain-containing protein [Terracidiphilus sp.]|nr:carboxypeptidase regulatory-like domain-containing protein [Terracidiphilus sp.]
MQRKRLFTSIACWLPVFVLLLAAGMTAAAQGIDTGGISGTVTDQTGAIIPAATVKVLGEATGITMQTTSDAQGAFEFRNVPVGSYTVTVSASGFGPKTVSHVQVASGKETPVGRMAMSLGTTSQTVEVEGGAAELINTESAQGEVVLDSAQLQTLPVNGGFDDVALVVPGIVMTHDDGMSNTNGTNFSANGERGRSNNFEIDGQSNNDNSVAGPSFFFSNQDAIQEISVISNDFGAQYGRNMGSVVNYITKSGSNSFHGTGFEMYTGDWLSSLTQTQKAPQFGWCSGGVTTGCSPTYVPRFVQNNWGGTLGGPVLRDKLWFFGGTFFSHTYSTGAQITSGGAFFPDANGLKELAASFPNNPAVAALTLNGPLSVTAGNPTSFGSTEMFPVTDGNSVADIETAQVKLALPSYTLDQEDIGRLDYQMTPNDRFYIRYNYQANPTVPCCGSFVGAGWVDVNGITHEVGADWTHTFTPHLIDQLRYSFQQSTIAFEGGAIPNCTISSFSPCTSSVTLGSSSLGNLTGYGYPGNLPQGRVVKVNQVQDNATWTRGRHTIVFGGEFDHQNSPNVFPAGFNGSFNFSPGASPTAFSYTPSSLTTSTTSGGCEDPTTGGNDCSNGITGSLEGISHTTLTAGNASIPFKEPDYAGYIQDNWKVMENLTLNLGLRYEFFSQSINLLHDESVAQQTGPNPFWSTSLPLSVTTFPKTNSDFRNIEPRFGFAYTPSWMNKMVVHGGYAINADPEFYNIFLDIATLAPLVNAGAFNCGGTNPQCVPANGLNYSTVQTGDLKFIPTGGDPRVNLYETVPTNFRNPMAETYTLGFQYQIFPSAVAEVRYVGNHTFDQFQSINANPDILDVQSAFPNYGSNTTPCTDTTAPGYTRPSCSNFLNLQVGNTAFSLYDGLQTSLTVRDFHSWTGTVSYTFSRTIDNSSEIFGTGSGGNTSAIAQNPLNTNIGERGVSGNSYPNVVGLQLAYNTPWFKNQSGMLGRLLGGYFFNAFYQYNGGQPFNPIQNAISVQSGPINAIVCGAYTAPDSNCTPAPGDTAAALAIQRATTSFCDIVWAENFGNPCRPVLSNKSAPLNSIGINLGPLGYYDYVTGSPTTAANEHWLWNNQDEAIAVNNPFPGVGRNILRGDSFNNLDLSIGKSFRINERVSMNLQMSAFNALNRAYYGTPDVNIEDSLASPNLFLSTYEAFGTTAESPAAGGAFGAGPGNRNVQLSGKIQF